MTKKAVPSWEQKYWQNRQAGNGPPKPSPVGQPDFRSALNGPLPTQGDWDITNKLASRIQMKAALESGGGGPNRGVADLIEGLPYYTRLNTEAFGHTASLFKVAGIINGPTSKNVTIKGEVQGYLVEGLSPVDMGNLGNKEKVALIEVSVPFLGNFLVPKEAVARVSSMNSPTGRTVLKG